MRIIAFIEDEQLVKKILKHLGLWDVKRKPTPRANGPPAEASIIYEDSPAPFLIIRLKSTFKKIQPQAKRYAMPELA